MSKLEQVLQKIEKLESKLKKAMDLRDALLVPQTIDMSLTKEELVLLLNSLFEYEHLNEGLRDRVVPLYHKIREKVYHE